MKDNFTHPCKQMDTPEWKEVLAVTITMNMIKTLTAIDADINAAKQSDPNLGPQLLAIGLDTLSDTTIDEKMGKMEALPAVAAAVKKHGFSMRQYLEGKLAFVTALFISAGVPEMYSLDQLKQQNCEVANVQFMLSHKDEIDKFMQAQP